MSRKITWISAAMMALMFVVAGTTMAAARTGAWVDEVVFVMEEDQNKAVARIESGEFDIYTLGVSQADLFKKIKASPKLDYEVSFGSYNELTFNPAGPVFTGTGKLNPFAIPAIREAVNWLIDRDYLTKEVLGRCPPVQGSRAPRPRAPDPQPRRCRSRIASQSEWHRRARGAA